MPFKADSFTQKSLQQNWYLKIQILHSLYFRIYRIYIILQSIDTLIYVLNMTVCPSTMNIYIEINEVN